MSSPLKLGGGAQERQGNERTSLTGPTLKLNVSLDTTFFPRTTSREITNIVQITRRAGTFP